MNPSPAPSGYALPCPTFSLASYSIPQSGTLTGTISPTSGVTEYIYTTGYVYNGSTWLPETIQGSSPYPGYSNTISTLTLNTSILSSLPLGAVYAVEWDWTWNATQQCYLGPGSSVCNQGSWRLQEFQLTQGGASTPYLGSPANIPGQIEAENYDNGGEGIAYHDNEPANLGGAYRLSEGVDISTITDNGVSGYTVGYTHATEWLNYTVNVTAGGAYTLSVRISSGMGGGTYHFEMDGANISGSLIVPNTGSVSTYTTVTQSVNLSIGQHVLKLAFDTNDSGGFDGNYNWFSFSNGSAISPTPTPTNTGGSYSLSNPPPYNWDPYVSCGTIGTNGTKSIFNCPLPNNCFDGNCGIMSRSTNDPGARYFATGNGTCTDGSCAQWIPVFPAGDSGAGNAGSDQGVPFYYGTAGNPTYSVAISGTNFKFHAPNGARYGGREYDEFFYIWDQTQQLMAQTYTYTGSLSGTFLPQSSCFDFTCAVPAGGGTHYFEAAIAGKDSDYYPSGTTYTENGWTLGGSGSQALGMAPMAGIVRFTEEAAANASNYQTINHPVQLSFACGYRGTNGGPNMSGYVFPATSGLLPCGVGSASAIAQNALQPLAGQLYICDYTKAQIDGMPLDPLAKAWLYACSKYGAYFTQTGGGFAGGGFVPVATGGYESQEAYSWTNTPFPFLSQICRNNPNFLTCTGSGYATEAYGSIQKNLPLLPGPGTTDWEGRSCSSACGFSGHFHAIDSCVVKTLAGVSGGC